MEWLHCNNCYFLPGTGKRFFLTSCGHIYCIDCKSLCCNSNVCKLCGNQCTSIPLSSQMKPEVEMYFIDPMELLKKSLTQVQQAAEFQNNHRARLMTYYKKQVQKNTNLKEEFKKLLKTVKEYDDEKQKLVKEIQYLQQLLNNTKYGVSTSHTGGAINYISPHQGQGSQGYSSLLTNFQQGISLQRNLPSLNDFFSPTDSNVSNSSYPHRVSIRTPPVNGKMGSVARITPTSALGNLRSHSQGVSPAYFTPESQTSHSRMLDGNKNSAGSGKKIKVQSRMQGIQKITVHPYSPCDDTPPNS